MFVTSGQWNLWIFFFIAPFLSGKKNELLSLDVLFKKIGLELFYFWKFSKKIRNHEKSQKSTKMSGKCSEVQPLTLFWFFEIEILRIFFADFFSFFFDFWIPQTDYIFMNSSQQHLFKLLQNPYQKNYLQKIRYQIFGWNWPFVIIRF